MNDEQTEYRAGQIVRVRMRVNAPGPDINGDVLLGRTGGLSRGQIYVPAADIVSVEPEPLAVGDLVKGGDSHSSPWRIVAIHGEHAWCCDSIFGLFATVALSGLVRA